METSYMPFCLAFSLAFGDAQPLSQVKMFSGDWLADWLQISAKLRARFHSHQAAIYTTSNPIPLRGNWAVLENTSPVGGTELLILPKAISNVSGACIVNCVIGKPKRPYISKWIIESFFWSLDFGFNWKYKEGQATNLKGAVWFE